MQLGTLLQLEQAQKLSQVPKAKALRQDEQEGRQNLLGQGRQMLTNKKGLML